METSNEQAPTANTCLNTRPRRSGRLCSTLLAASQ